MRCSRCCHEHGFKRSLADGWGPQNQEQGWASCPRELYCLNVATTALQFDEPLRVNAPAYWPMALTTSSSFVAREVEVAVSCCRRVNPLAAPMVTELDAGSPSPAKISSLAAVVAGVKPVLAVELDPWAPATWSSGAVVLKPLNS